jgi:type II secretory pathway component PulF
MNPWLAWGSLVAPVIVAMMALLVVPQFAEVFRNFGAELPAPTRLLSRYPGLVFVWPLVIGMAAAAWRRRARRGIPLLVLSLVGSFVVFAGVIAALYLPIFKLAATI